MDNIVDMREYDVPYHMRLSIDLKIHVVRDKKAANAVLSYCCPWSCTAGPSPQSLAHRKVKWLMCSPSLCLSPELHLICRAVFLGCN